MTVPGETLLQDHHPRELAIADRGDGGWSRADCSLANVAGALSSLRQPRVAERLGEGRRNCKTSVSISMVSLGFAPWATRVQQAFNGQHAVMKQA
jgi:hypothetical protein